MFNWILKPFLCLALGMSALGVEFRGTGTNDGINFGVVPQISNLSQKSYSAWIYADSYASGFIRMIFYNVTKIAGARMYLSSDKLVFSEPFSSAGGVWTTSANPFPTGQWVHIVITYNNTSTSNDPIIYINGTSVSVTRFTAPVGTVLSDTGANWNIGNENSGGYVLPFDGKIKDVRVYNRILSAAEVTTLYNGGTPDMDLVTDGLQFQAFVVPTFRLTDFVDTTLTSDMKVRDRIYGVVGTPHGSPIGRNP